MKAFVPVLALSVALLAGCTPGTPDDSITDSPSPTFTATPVPDPVETAVPDDGDEELRANIADAMNSGNTAALEGYLADTVHITYAASENEGDVSDHSLVIDNLTRATGPGVTWDFDLPASLIDDYRNNPGSGGSYVDDFPDGAIVGKSSEDYVLSFAVEDGTITRILFGDEYSLIFE
jgi:hypothetical protein